MKARIITVVAVVLMAATLFSGCNVGVGPTPTLVPTSTPEPESEIVSIEATELFISNGKVTVGLMTQLKNESLQLEMVLLQGEAEVARKNITAENGYARYQIECSQDKAKGELDVMITEKGEQRVALKIKNGVPQLTADGVKCVINAMSVMEKANLVTGVREPKKVGTTGETYVIKRLGIPAIEMADGPAGIRFTKASVWYPSVSNLSASWDRELVSTVSQSIGEDALALGMDIVLAPGMNLQKNILCGRNFEYCSEDPFLTAQIATNYVNGIQSTGAQACIKHFAANSQESARYTVSSNVTERALRELYLKAFADTVRDSSPAAVMSSYNRLNGVYTSNSYELLTLILRAEMGFDGLVMSDWDSKGDIVDKIKAGNDINMPGNADDPDKVIAAINNGSLKLAQLDEACKNILNTIVSSPSFNGYDMNDNTTHRENTKEHEKISANAAQDTIVMLKNNGALPFDEGTKVALFGNGGFRTVFGGAGSGSVSPTRQVTIANGLRQSAELDIYDYDNNIFKGCGPHVQGDESADIKVSSAYAKAQAAGADAAVIVFSRDSQESYDRSSSKGDFMLNDTELEMLERVSKEFHALGKKVIAVLNVSAPMEVASWRDKVDGILYCGYAGQATGTAVANVLSGKVNPSAKTVSSWPISYNDTPSAESFPGNALDVTYNEDIYVGYRYYTTFDLPVAYPFGYGLSYTRFNYSNITLQDDGDSITVKLNVKNIGKVAGREIVQLYVSKPETLQEQAKIELCGFEKTREIAPDETVSVSITVKKEQLATYSEKTSSWVLQSGEYELFVGTNSDKLTKAGGFDQDNQVTVKDVENRCVPDEEFKIITKDTFDPNASENKRENIALNKKTWSNYCESPSHASDYAVDGSRTSRWSGFVLYDKDHIWQVDLGKKYSVGQIEIFWQTIGKPFTVLTSQDGVTFTKYKTYNCDESLQSSINLHGEKTRFIRIEIPRGSFISIFEFKAYEATAQDLSNKEATNVALNKNTTASVGQSEHPKEYAVDGNASTRWSADYSGNAYLQVDLGAQYTVKGVELVLESAWNTYKVEYSTDGQSYKLLAQGNKDQLSLTVNNLNVKARYIRVSRDGEGWFSIIDLSVLA